MPSRVWSATVVVLSCRVRLSLVLSHLSFCARLTVSRLLDIFNYKTYILGLLFRRQLSLDIFIILRDNESSDNIFFTSF